MKRYKQDCFRPYIESTNETMVECPDGKWVIYKDHETALDELREIVAGQFKVIARYQKMEDEIDRMKSALVRVQNFPSHPGGHPDDRSDEANCAESWRHGWICAVGAMQDAALPDT